MKICPHCGREQPDENIYCSFCLKSMIQLRQHREIEDYVMPEQEQEEIPAEGEEKQTDYTTDDLSNEQNSDTLISQEKPKERGKRWILILLIAAVVVGGAAYLVQNPLVSKGASVTVKAGDAAQTEEYEPEVFLPDTDDDATTDAMEPDENTVEADDYATEETVTDEPVTDEPQEETDIDRTEESLDEEYVLPTSSNSYLTAADLEGLSAYECRIARNEIYARHGRKFDDSELQEYFNSRSWYHGTIEPKDFQGSELNNVEIANLDLIVQYEKEHFD